MKKDISNILIITTLASFVLIICFLDRHFYKKNRKEIEHFETNGYHKMDETVVPNSFLQVKEKGNLDQCKKACDDDSKCIGFTRENIDDDSNGECNLIHNVDGCFNENNKASDKFNLAPNMSVDYEKYNTFLKTKHTDLFDSNRMKCIQLDELVSLKHNKYPFDLVYQNGDGKFTMKKVENTASDKEKVKAIFKIVKGLSGSGVSFMVERDGGEYYMVNKPGKEEVLLEQKQDGGQFKKNASFEIDSQYSEKPHLFGIRKMVGNRDLYLKINQTNKKVIMTNINDVGLDKTPILFEQTKPIIDTFDTTPEIVPAPTELEEDVKDDDDLRLEKQEELEKLELEIREVQHKQNMKLMNVMLDVNKFKLMDLSMSDYLRKCNQHSSDEMIDVISNNSNNMNNNMEVALGNNNNISNNTSNNQVGNNLNN